MSDNTSVAGGLRCHWVQVTDASGRTVMEARWSSEASAANTSVSSAA